MGVFVITLWAMLLYLAFVNTYVASRLWQVHSPFLAFYVNRSDPVLAEGIGDYYFGGGAYDLEKAQKSYELVARLDSNKEFAHYQLARIYFVEGDFSHATSAINEELRISPYNLRSLYVRGLIEDAQHNELAAEQDFARFIEWAPTEWGGYNDLSLVLAKEWKYAESEKVLHAAFLKVSGAQTNPWLWNSLGLAQLNQLHYQDAAVSFQKALTLVEGLTPREWRRAYSGNDPTSDAESIKSFQQAIGENLATTKTGATIERKL